VSHDDLKAALQTSCSAVMHLTRFRWYLLSFVYIDVLKTFSLFRDTFEDVTHIVTGHVVMDSDVRFLPHALRRLGF
jgi:hypothetical protein